MELREYTPADEAACLAIFDGNTPPFFAPHERQEFAEFLGQHDDPYFVVERDGLVVACGGYFRLPNTPAAVLTWGMVAREHHRQGIGRFLLLARLHRLCQDRGIEVVKLETSQHSAGFFEKVGFVAESVKEDGYGPGLHLYRMGLALDERRRAALAGATA